MMNAPGGSHPGGRIIAGASHPDGTARRIIAVPCGADAGEGAAPRTVAHPGGQASVDGGASQPVHASHPAEVSQPAGGASQASAVLLSQPAAHRGSLATWSGNANGLAPSAFIPATPARPAPLGAFSREGAHGRVDAREGPASGRELSQQERSAFSPHTGFRAHHPTNQVMSLHHAHAPPTTPDVARTLSEPPVTQRPLSPRS
eukprot:CAMPEP_0180302644 /NCGR_PEP_ID=MMETSP0988-20121125/24422_1 /TAXON_ID=697907 /ORGANISM="non described non described, Strain CCMP2293" /LENGTH=202 /DNA_ID=CAMNT_0022283863 /DNA_START=17 /DNA_END=622 /DNA_ORIENTATION=-